MRHLVQSFVRALALLATCMGLANTSQAMTASPLILEMNSTGQHMHSSITVTNPGTKVMPVEIQIFRMDIAEDGSFSKVAAEDDFSVYPPQANIQPRSSQVFRIRWAGEPLKKSESYIVEVKEIPVVQRESHGVQLALTVQVLALMHPASGVSSLELVSYKLIPGEGGGRVALTVANNGVRHAKLSDAIIKLSSPSRGWTATLTAGELYASIGQGLVMPAKRRHFVLPTVIPENVEDLNVRIFHEPAIR